MWPLACNGNKDVNKTGMVYALLKFNIYLVWERDTTLLITYIYMCTKISIMIKMAWAEEHSGGKCQKCQALYSEKKNMQIFPFWKKKKRPKSWLAD